MSGVALSGGGRPLRFLGLFLGGWVCIRAGMLMSPLWNAPELGAVAARGLAVAPVAEREAVVMAEQPTITASAALAAAQPSARSGARARAAAGAPAEVSWSKIALREPEPDGEARGREQSSPEPALVAPPGRGGRRWSGSAWLLWRPEVGRGAVQAPLLGGSQMGARLDYRLGEAVSLYGRVSRALTGPSSEEAALGVAWRAGSLPFSVLAERRQRIGPGGRNGFALLVAGGLNPREIAPHVEVDGYVQAGMVGLPGRDAFIDGKSSIGYRLKSAAPGWDMTVGGALSGSAQPGVERLDVGPEVRVRLPIGPAAVRLSAEYRARISGQARPSSGPAITLVSDF